MVVVQTLPRRGGTAVESSIRRRTGWTAEFRSPGGPKLREGRASAVGPEIGLLRVGRGQRKRTSWNFRETYGGGSGRLRMGPDGLYVKAGLERDKAAAAGGAGRDARRDEGGVGPEHRATENSRSSPGPRCCRDLSHAAAWHRGAPASEGLDGLAAIWGAVRQVWPEAGE